MNYKNNGNKKGDESEPKMSTKFWVLLGSNYINGERLTNLNQLAVWGRRWTQTDVSPKDPGLQAQAALKRRSMHWAKQRKLAGTSV